MEENTEQYPNNLWITEIQKFMPDIKHYGCTTPEDYIREFHEYLESKYKPKNFDSKFGERPIPGIF